MIGWFRRPKVQSIMRGDRLPKEAGALLYNRVVYDVEHRHAPHLGNYARFTMDDEFGIEVEFWFGRSWDRSD